MKLAFAVLASLVTFSLASPAHAAWDFSWLTSTAFGQSPAGEPPVTRRLAGSSTATITPQGSGLRIGFDTSLGAASAGVQSDGFAIGSVPIFACRDCAPGVITGDTSGTYTFTGAFGDPSSFTLALNGGGSGPAGVVRFIGTGTRVTTEAAEPASLLLAGAGLLAAARWRRRRLGAR